MDKRIKDLMKSELKRVGLFYIDGREMSFIQFNSDGMIVCQQCKREGASTMERNNNDIELVEIQNIYLNK